MISHEWAQWTSGITFQHEKIKFISPSDHAMFYLLYNRVKHIFKKILKADWMRVISHVCDINDIYTTRIGFLSSWYHSVSHHMLYNKSCYCVEIGIKSEQTIFWLHSSKKQNSFKIKRQIQGRSDGWGTSVLWHASKHESVL